VRGAPVIVASHIGVIIAVAAEFVAPEVVTPVVMLPTTVVPPVLEVVAVVLVVIALVNSLVALVQRVDPLRAVVVASAMVVAVHVLVFGVEMAGLVLNVLWFWSRVSRLTVLGRSEGREGQKSDERKQIFHHISPLEETSDILYYPRRGNNERANSKLSAEDGAEPDAL